MQITRLNVTFDDGSTQTIDVPTASPVVVTPPPPVFSGGMILRGGYFDGIPDNQAKSYADQFSISMVRIWHTIKWEETLGVSHPTFLRARALQAQGLKVLCVMTPPEKTGAPPDSPDVATKYFQSAEASANGAIDAWEIWNEPNLANYNVTYATSSTRWIKNALAPAYQVLHAASQFVVSGGWSEDLSGIPWMIQNGLIANCDAVGYHPYGGSAAEHIKRVQTMRNLIGNKPLWLTEWNLHESGNAAWADDLIVAANGIKQYVNAVFHFRMVRTTQAAGYAAPFYDDGGTLVQTAGFHDKLIAAMKVFP